MRVTGLAVLLLAPSIATAQLPASRSSSIIVTGVGEVDTPPDTVEIVFTARGEGATANAASAQLAKTQSSVLEGLGGFLTTPYAVETGKMSIASARSAECKAGDDDDARLSTGTCAVKGYVATLSTVIRTSDVAHAGTATGLIAHLGAVDAGIREFGLNAPQGARSRALAAAMVHARAQANAIAEASGARLGALISVTDNEANGATDIIVTAQRRRIASAPVEPVEIALSPEPIRTTARLTVTFAIQR